MKNNSETPAPSRTRLTLPVGLGFLFTLMLVAIITSDTFSKLVAEAEETGSTVVWYVQGGYWRDDVEVYLAHAENVFCPNGDTASKISLEEADE